MTTKLRLLYTMILCAISLVDNARTSYETQRYSLDDGLPSNLTTCVDQDSRGLLWIGTWRGLCCFDGYEFMSFDNAGDEDQRPMCSRIHSVKFDKDDNVWCVTYDRRAYMFSPTTCQWTDVSKVIEDKYPDADFRIRNIYPIKTGVVWLTCYEEDGMIFRIAHPDKMDGVTNEYDRMNEPRNKAEKILWSINKREAQDVSHITPLKSARKVFVDSQQNVWHLDNQLTRYTPREVNFVIEDVEPGRNTRTIPTLQDIDGHQVYSTLTDSKGRQWKGTKGGGLYLDGRRQDTNGNDVYDIFEDSQGHIWAACYDSGLNLLIDGKFVNQDNRLTNYPKDRFTKVRHIMETADGVIFLSTADGIVCFSNSFNKPEDIEFHTYTQSRDKTGSLPGGNVMQTLQTGDGGIYISTMTGGLIAIMDGNPLRDNLVFQPVSETQSTEGVVLAMIEDNDGALWLARENYLEKYKPATGETMVFGKKDFGREVYFSEATPMLDEVSGNIVFGTFGGTLSMNPNSLTKSNMSPKILFSAVQYQGSQDKLPILYADQLDVPSSKRNLTIYFSALDYQDNSLVQYAYRIVDDDFDIDDLEDTGNVGGIDSNWNYVGRAHCASFNNLPSGHLRLLVKSTNADGVWSDNVAQLRIYSHPTFWETPWAWLLYILVVLALVAIAVYIVQMRNRHRLEREELERKLEQLLASLEKPAEPAPKEHTFALKEVEIESDEKRLMEKLMAYLNDNISNNDLKISDLADAVGMSRSVFYDCLKAITGMSPIEFIRYLRIQRAKQMLANTDTPISQIAYETGFSDPTYFAKVFKKAVGQSPNTFRKSLREPSTPPPQD